MLNPGWLKELPTLYPIPRIISPYSEIPQISYGDGLLNCSVLSQKAGDISNTESWPALYFKKPEEPEFWYSSTGVLTS